MPKTTTTTEHSTGLDFGERNLIITALGLLLQPNHLRDLQVNAADVWAIRDKIRNS